jgi:ribosomal protein L11 methyltransferase
MSSAAPANPSSLVARLETDERTANKIAELVADRFAGDNVAVSFSDAGGGHWQVAIHFRAPLDQDAVRAAVAAAAGRKVAAALQFGRVAATDWVRQSLAGLAPVAAGRFVVHGAHDRARVPRNRIGIEIEAALAFGTGHHGTTRGCLVALDAICKLANKRKPVFRHPEVRAKRASKDRRPARPPFAGRAMRGRLRVTKKTGILDVGTGSGVLAIAAARALRAHVLATDIDVAAVRAARDNIRRNRAAGFVAVVAADGIDRRAIRVRAPFDLILANILLGPLQRIAAPLRHVAAPGARVVLSGILRSQANAVIAAYRPLVLQHRVDIDGWTTLVLRRRAPRQRAVARSGSAT